MSDATTRLPTPRLRALVEEPGVPPGLPRPGTQREPAPGSQACDLCRATAPRDHRHLLDVEDREVLCACRACSVLFDGGAAGGDHYRLIPDRCRALAGFRMDDVTWRSLRLPVDLAFFVRQGASGAVTAYYPSPAGATESLLELDDWAHLETENPVLSDMEPDVEALLVNRVGGARGYWLVGVDQCYRLVAVVRGNWRGFTGGDEVWSQIRRFFEDLHARADTVAC